MGASVCVYERDCGGLGEVTVQHANVMIKSGEIGFFREISVCG